MDLEGARPPLPLLEADEFFVRVLEEDVGAGAEE